VFGSTGQTGMELVKQALAADHHVTAFLRDPAKMTISDEKLVIEKVDIFDSKAISEKLGGHDMVFSCLGFKPEKPAVTGYTRATESIVEAMKSHEMKRIIICHSWYTELESRGQAVWFIRWFLLPMIKTVLDNMRETEVWLDNQEGLEFTVVRPAGLANSPVTDKEIKATEGAYHVDGAAGRIARADVARFMLSCANKDEYKAKQLAIGI